MSLVRLFHMGQCVLPLVPHISENEALLHKITGNPAISYNLEFMTFVWLSTTLSPENGTNLTWLDKALREDPRSLIVFVELESFILSKLQGTSQGSHLASYRTETTCTTTSWGDVHLSSTWIVKEKEKVLVFEHYLLIHRHFKHLKTDKYFNILLQGHMSVPSSLLFIRQFPNYLPPSPSSSGHFQVFISNKTYYLCYYTLIWWEHTHITEWGTQEIYM